MKPELDELPTLEKLQKSKGASENVAIELELLVGLLRRSTWTKITWIKPCCWCTMYPRKVSNEFPWVMPLRMSISRSENVARERRRFKENSHLNKQKTYLSDELSNFRGRG